MERKRPFRLNLGITALNLILFCHQGSSLSFVTMWSSLDFVNKKFICFYISQSCSKGNVQTDWYLPVRNSPSSEVVTKAEILEHF